MIAIVTTIQEPTECIRGLAAALSEAGSSLVVIGDTKGPASFDLEGAQLFSLEDQSKLPFSLAQLLPTGHYARKNLGYLIAMSRKADCIYETDDDNAPLPAWAVRSVRPEAQKVAPTSWLNVYRLFCDEMIWPRGFPLGLLHDPATCEHDPNSPLSMVHAPIQQGLVALSPDVDAVWRLVMAREVTFEHRPSVWLPPGTWCPFNSQSTWWWGPAFPLMYLPSYCSFRMTDIWRSFIAQRCLWEMDLGIVFHAPEVVQQRNVHNLMHDFEDEVPGYLGNERIATRLMDLSLEPCTDPASAAEATAANLCRCYERLVGDGFLGPDEMQLVQAWVKDLANIASE